MAVVLLATPPSALAAPVCSDAKSGPEMGVCLGVHAQRLERRVDRIGKRIRGGLTRIKPADDLAPPVGVATLEVRFDAAATAWSRYRDAECDAQTAPFAQAEVEPVMRLLCRVNLATARLTELKHAYKDALSHSQDR